MSGVMKEVTRKIRDQQGKQRSHVWHTGEHLLEFLGRYPQYAELISDDLDNESMSLTNFEKEIARAAHANGGGLGGRDADDVLRKFYGLPAEEDGTPAQTVSGAGSVRVNLLDYL